MGKPWDDFLIENEDDARAVFMDWFKINQKRYSLDDIITERNGWSEESTAHRNFLEKFINKRRADLIKIWTEE